MGYSTCIGMSHDRHLEKRVCDRCDKCPSCDDFAPRRLYCWYCCGPLVACPDCLIELSNHIVSKGPPPEQWKVAAGAGYETAKRNATTDSDR